MPTLPFTMGNDAPERLEDPAGLNAATVIALLILALKRSAIRRCEWRAHRARQRLFSALLDEYGEGRAKPASLRSARQPPLAWRRGS